MELICLGKNTLKQSDNYRWSTKSNKWTNTVRGPSYGSGGSGNGEFGFKNYQSHLPEVYSGHPNRIERYNQYENMDNDSESKRMS